MSQIEDRFWARVTVTGFCWTWDHPASDGYGRFYDGTKNVLAHRFSYNALVGDIPSGLDVDHVCRNRACVNPDHLQPVTRAENVRRSPLVGRVGGSIGVINSLKDRCTRGHPLRGGNVRVYPSGSRGCRACQRELQIDRRTNVSFNHARADQFCEEYLQRNGE